MVDPAVKEQILKDLERLSPFEQARAAELVHELVAPTPRGIPGRELLRFSGTFDSQALREMSEAIEEGCERVDPDGW
ncbi:MAG TPA: hypothetical protein VGE98_01255 [Thermoanaerobaculia bacterium]